MRYVLHFNPEGTNLVGNGSTIEFAKLPKALASGATTKVRISEGGDIPFTARDTHETRYGATVSATVAKAAGLRGKQRYTLVAAGKSGWFNLVPHSRISGGRARRIDGPGVSVSTING